MTAISSVSPQQSTQKPSGADRAQKEQEYQQLAQQAAQLGINNIPQPGKGAIEQLTQLIASKEGQQSQNPQKAQQNPLQAAGTVGLAQQTQQAGIGQSLSLVA